MTHQLDMFGASDTPLFSGTPQRAKADTFTPQLDPTYQAQQADDNTVPMDLFTDGDFPLLHIYTNTRYILNSTNQPWGRIIGTSKAQHLVRVNTPLGVTEFGAYEIQSWVSGGIISPVCGICNQPVHYGGFQSHLSTHKVNIHA